MLKALGVFGTAMPVVKPWQDGWEEIDGHLRVHGEKRAGRDRWVPLMIELAPPQLTMDAFAKTLKRSGLGVTPIDGRRSFAFWMELARIWDTHQQAYMGHGRRTITDLYRGHDVAAFLDDDAEKLRALVVGKLVGSPIDDTTQVVMSRLGIEPRTYGLKVRRVDSPLTEGSGT